MTNGIFTAPRPRNEPVLGYAPGSPERRALRAELERLAGEVVEITPRIGGARVATGRTAQAVMPHDHHHVLAVWHQAGAAEVGRAIDAALAAHGAWSRLPWEQRAAVFLRAAELLAGPWRMTLNAATMLGQSKTAHQAEVDSACELIDFWRFNVAWAEEIYRQQPESAPGCWNRLEHRPLEGFVLAVTPFNFTSIAGNLPTAPALMGNTVVWKPASSAVYAAHVLMDLLEAAGLPPGVVNLVPGAAAEVGGAALASPELAGVHFTGSTATFRTIWEAVGRDITRYRNYPRLVGETGGKDFVLAHPTADPAAVATALTRGAFEYQGQKCSAASRAFVPASLWPEVERRLLADIAALRVGDVRDFTNFMGAVIDRAAFAKVRGYLDLARRSPDAEILAGGGADDRTGWFVEPTVVRARSPELPLLREEIFGPVLTVWVYADDALDEAVALCDRGTPYALTGAIFARDRAAIGRLTEALVYAAGNFYVNDKPTGAVVGQQPFGGARLSGTDDKAGSPLNLQRWVSPRAIKETLAPPTDFRYPYLAPGD
ncbi:MAG: 1-pyrroline-5-carboxylate dehydrogenase [Candidatus Rokubacteria bacterium RIFCSPLOWO2_12_FULL_71_22]|nr:MAG: 1-pyrroline-5-carboxylate dehydrogenase [Candidatus Rokubacteria bacterium RIFCSPLOWO2_12_FULL_71_22]